MNPQLLAQNYHRALPLIRRLPNWLQIKIASSGRKLFMEHFLIHQPTINYTPPKEHGTTLWGINFRSPLGNSAGMFKNGEGYDFMAQIGAGFYLGGTSTTNPRHGNSKKHITHPFISLPQSGMALNFMGLPNLGDEILSRKPITTNKTPGVPIGWSVMRSPDYPEQPALEKLITSIQRYLAHPLVDFIEINESCPNIAKSTGNLIERIDYLGNQLQPLASKKPLIIKLSCDLNEQLVESMVTRLIELGFAGITLGNTSTDYGLYQHKLPAHEQSVFNYFTANFGGGISGKSLNSRSLRISAIAAEVTHKLSPNHEFHIIRSGGVASYNDMIDARKHGISLSQWFSGFFDNYTIFGDKLYQQLWNTPQ